MFYSFCSAIIFYTIIPLPENWTNRWERIARWIVIVGVIIGLLLSSLDLILYYCTIARFTRSALIVAFWIWLTGGLHLDGAMDSADGLAVNSDRQKRLEVMKDSTTGAFGAMAGTIIIILKIIALSEITKYRWLALIFATIWGRWGQILAIALYPYARETGKGSFHKENIHLPEDILWGLGTLLCCSGILWWLEPENWYGVIIITGFNFGISYLTGYYFDRQLQGHTGDTYGAVVEWSEALILCFLTIFFA